MLGVLVSQFPELHETFVIRELASLRDGGIPLRIYSLKRCRDEIIHDEAKSLLPITVYVAWDDPAVWLAGLGQFLRHPVKGLRALGWVLRHHVWPPAELAKALVIWVQSMAMAGRVRAEGITHLHAHWATMPTTAAVLLSGWHGMPFSMTAHAWDIFVRNPTLAAKVRLASRVITCTEYNQHHLQAFCPEAREKIILNYHGVDIAKFKRPPAAWDDEGPHTPVFLSVGRLVDTKGYPVLIEAYAHLRRKHPEFRAVIVGQGPLRAEVEAAILRHGLQDVVDVRPAMGQDELRKLYAGAAALVVPSVVAPNGDRDGIPNVILEGMAMGVPVVSTTVSGIPEAVQDRRTGLLVPPGDAKALAHGLEIILRRPHLAHVMGNQGRMWVETQFRSSEHMQRLIVQMNELLRREAGDTRHDVHVSRLMSPVPKKVMYVIWSLEIGGAERVVAHLAKGLDRTKYAPMVVCLNHPGALAAELAEAGVPVIALHKRGGLDLGLLDRLTQLMREHRPAVVHTHLWGAGLWGRMAAQRAGVPVIIAHEHGMQPWRGAAHFLADRYLLGATRRVLFASRDVMADYARRVPGAGKKSHWLRNGVEAPGASDRAAMRRRQGWAESDRIILSIGRLSPEKGHTDLLAAFGKLAATCPAAKLVIVGTGPEQAALEALQAKLGLNGRVMLAGAQADVAPWLAAADVYVQPSRREALSLAVLEAMMAGVPVVATRVGDMPQVITHGHSGYLVPADDPHALTEAILEILNNPAPARAAAAAAREAARAEYSLERMVRDVESIYAAELA